MSRGQQLRAALAAGDHAAVLTLLGDLSFLEERCRESIDALLDDLRFVLRNAPAPLPAEVSLAHPSGARLDREVVARIEAILDGAREELSRGTVRLFPLLYNELFWHDAPDRAVHHEGLATPATDRQLWRWMEACRARFAGPWLRTLRPPAVPRAAVTSWRATASVRSISSDGTRLLAKSDALFLVDARTGAVRATVSNVAGADGQFARDGDVFVVRAGTSAQLWSGEPPTPGATLGPHTHNVADVVFSCDGNHIITQARHELRAFLVADGTCVATRTLRNAISRILPCAGGVLVHDGKSWRHWDYARDLIGRARLGGYAEWTAVTPFGDLVVTVGGGKVSCWTLPDAKVVFEQPSDGSSIAFHPSGDSFVMRTDYSEISVFDATSGAKVGNIRSAHVASMTYDPTGRYLVFECSWGPSRLWDLAASRVAAELHVRHGVGSRVVFSQDGSVLALGIREATTIVDIRSLVPLVRWRDDSVAVGEYSKGYFSPTGETLVVSHHRTQLSFWDVERGVIRRQVAALKVTLFDRGSRVLGRCGDALIAFATEDGEEVWRAVLPPADESVIAADAARLLLLSDTRAHRLIALGMDDGQERYRFDGETVVRCEGEVMLTRTRAGDVVLRRVDRGDELLTLAALGGDGYALSPDRRWLAVSRHHLEIWDLTTRTRTQTLPASGTTSFSFRDNASLETWRWETQQSGNQDRLVEAVFDVRTGACLGHSSRWENEVEGSASEIASGVMLDGALHVDGVPLALPRDPIIVCTRSGAIRVASVSGGRVELYALQRVTGESASEAAPQPGAVASNPGT